MPASPYVNLRMRPGTNFKTLHDEWFQMVSCASTHWEDAPQGQSTITWQRRTLMHRRPRHQQAGSFNNNSGEAELEVAGPWQLYGRHWHCRKAGRQAL